MKLVTIGLLIPGSGAGGGAICVLTESGRAGIFNPSAHGFSEVLGSPELCEANNNGSAFAGLSANTPFYNLLLGIVMQFPVAASG